ncbi:MAG: fibronectin type III domain-containing protein [Bacteroidales bacterium]|nr:fibronectin type III domain-containing protein [Bacteroidales bacterium]
MTLPSGLVLGQDDFTVSIEATDKYGGFFTPIKAGGSFQFKIEVKNNLADTCTVSVRKSTLDDVENWVTIDGNSLVLFPSQTRDFLLKVSVPSNAGDYDYIMKLNFDAYDKDNNHYEFDYRDQIIIVDNSAPETPSFSVSQTSTTIFVNSWYSWDDRSKTYTDLNQSSGIGGIKTYTVAVKNPDGTVKASISKNAADYSYHTFTGLTPNTNYKASVTAIDLAGNPKTLEKAATTVSAAPTNLSAIDVRYFSFTLGWNAMPGATSYEVYDVTGQEAILIGNPTSPLFAVNDLLPGRYYKYAVKSVSAVGKSDMSSTLTVRTLMPYITGPTTICSQETYSIGSYLVGATVQWSYTGKVILTSGQGTSSAVYTKNGDGVGEITAIVTYQGKNITLEPFQVNVGVPLRPYIYDGTTTKTTASVSYVMTYGSPTTSLQLNFIHQPGSFSDNWVTQKGLGSDFDLVDNGAYVIIIPTDVGGGSFTVQGENECGISSPTNVYITIRESGDGGGRDLPVLPTNFTLSPNPATDQITVTLETSETGNAATQSLSSGASFEVQLWEESELIKVVQASGRSVQLPISTLPAGAYYIRVVHNGQSSSHIFFKY